MPDIPFVEPVETPFDRLRERKAQERKAQERKAQGTEDSGNDTLKERHAQATGLLIQRAS